MVSHVDSFCFEIEAKGYSEMATNVGVDFTVMYLKTKISEKDELSGIFMQFVL